MTKSSSRTATPENGAKVVINPGEEQDGAGDRSQDCPRRLGHRLGRQKADREPEVGAMTQLGP